MSHLNRTLAILCLLTAVGAIALYYISRCSGGVLSCPLSQEARTWRLTSASEAPLTSAGCSRDWQGHVRTASRPLDFQWLALSETSKDVSLLGPDGGAVPLQKLGPLTLLNNTAYRFEPRAAGSHTLLVSNERVSQFHWHPSDCYCPTDSFSRFLDQYDCSAEMGARIKENMARWRPGYITPEMLEFNGDPFLHTDSIFLQFAIIKNKLYCRRRDGQPNCPLPTEGPHWFARLNPVVHMIQAVLRRVEIPDLVFFWNQGDNPFMGHYTFQPLFSQSSTAWHADQLLPTFRMAADKFSGLDVILAATGKPWEERDDVAHFVGHLTGQPRDQARGSPLLNPRVRAAEVALERWGDSIALFGVSL